MSEDVAGDLGAVLMKEIAATAMAGLEVWRILAARRTQTPGPDVELSRQAADFAQRAQETLGQADEDLGRARELLAKGDDVGCAAAMVDHTRHLSDAAGLAAAAERAGEQAVEVLDQQSPALQSLRTARAAGHAARQRGSRSAERAVAAGLLTTTGARRPSNAPGEAQPGRAPQPALQQRQTPARRRG